MKKKTATLVPAEDIRRQIHVVRGKRVMLDADLARFYGVSISNLNKAVSRNRGRFPEDFAFRLSVVETRASIFQSGTSNAGRGGVRIMPATTISIEAEAWRIPRKARRGHVNPIQP